MKFHTTKFGTLDIDSERIILFPDGIAGFESHRHWVLLSESDEETIGWLQSLTDPAVAFLVVTPHRFVPGYASKSTVLTSSPCLGRETTKR